MPSPKLFLILLDALRHDYISKDATPFLFSLKQESRHARVIETFGFNTRPAFFAGLFPEECSQCHLFEFNPELSSFKLAKYFSVINRGIQSPTAERLLRKLLRLSARSIERQRGNLAAAAVCSPFEVPLEILPYLAFAERKLTDEPGVYSDNPTIFDNLRKRNLTWSWIAYPKYHGSSKNIIKQFNAHPQHDVAFLHFSELDWIGHKFGPESKELYQTLKDLDLTLQELLSPFISQGGKLVVFGDHGMVSTKPSVDLESKIQSLGLKIGKDLIYFLDSTQARFWFFNSLAETKIRSALENLAVGRFLNQDDYARLRIRFSDNRFGDSIFMLKGGEIIHPSFFDRSPNAPRGMHGYLPEVKDNATQAFAYGFGSANLGEIMLTDVSKMINDAIDRL